MSCDSEASETAWSSADPVDESILRLLRTALSDKALPTVFMPGDSWDKIHALVASNSVEGAAWVGVERAGGPDALRIPSGLASRWCSEADATMWRALQFEVEREAVFAEMSNAGIAHMSLKGVVVAPLYPDPRMRSMADNDILYAYVEPAPNGGFRVPGFTAFDRARRVRNCARDLQRIMVSRGYETEGILDWHHDEYLKKPVFNFEMHRGLVRPNSELSAYWASPWTRAIHCAGDDPYEFRMAEEDVYLFHVAHAYDHFTSGGCGVRHALDEIVFLRAYGEAMDWPHIFGELAAMGGEVAAFEGRLRRASLAAFGDDEERVGFAPERDWGITPEDAFGLRLSDEDKGFLEYLIGSGTYGKESQRLANAARKTNDGLLARVRYVWERLAMEPAGRALEHPLLGSYKVLFPVFIVARLVKAAHHAPRLVRELESIG